MSYNSESHVNTAHIFCFFLQDVFTEAVGSFGHLAQWNNAWAVQEVGVTGFSDGSE